MKREELVKLKRAYLQEIERRKRINKLLDNKDVNELIELLNIEIENDRVSLEELSILREILKDKKIISTNSIYVCISTKRVECDVCYQDTTFREINVSFDSPYREIRLYKDIENGHTSVAHFSNEEAHDFNTVEYFEKNNIVLNPHNSSENNNDYQLVREDYILNSIKFGQPKSKKLLLEKYPRI